jgi:hypothetical protein
VAKVLIWGSDALISIPIVRRGIGRMRVTIHGSRLVSLLLCFRSSSRAMHSFRPRSALQPHRRDVPFGSRGVSMAITQEPAQPLSTLDRLFTPGFREPRK